MQTELSLNQTIKVRSVWISDSHLGFRGCSADYLLNFLHQVECDYLYLVGDIVDVWEMKKRMFWPQAHNNVIQMCYSPVPGLVKSLHHGSRLPMFLSSPLKPIPLV